MTVPELKTTFTEAMQSYLAALDRYSDEQFAAKPDEAEWSLGQMYQHIYEANTFFFLANTKRCLEKRKGQDGGEWLQGLEIHARHHLRQRQERENWLRIEAD